MKKRGYTADRRRRIRWLKIRRALFFLVCALLLLALIYGTVQGWRRLNNLLTQRKDNKQLELLEDAELPDFVDIQLISKGKARSGVDLERVNDIVIHYVGNPATTAQNNRDYFAKRTTEVCSHFVVGLEGEVIQCLPLNERSAASNHRNKDTISIEVCHPDESGEFNEATYDSLIRLTAWLCDTAGIERENVIRHYDVTGKLCPVYYVQNEEKWQELKKDVKEYGK